MSSRIGRDVLVQRRADLLSTRVDDEIVLLNIERGSYHALNAVASRIWQYLDAPMTVSQLIAAMLECFRGDPTVIATDVDTLLSSLSELGLIVLTPTPGA